MKNLSLGLAVLLLPAVGAAQFLDSRNRAMGGTGVASSHYTAAGFINPALLTTFDSSDSFAFILPSVGVLAADRDGVIDAIQDFQDEVDAVQAKLASMTLGPNDLTNLTNSLAALDGKRATIGLGGGLAVALPSKSFAWALVAHTWAEGQIGVNIDPGDAAIITGATTPGDLDTMASEGRILGTGVLELGIAVATEITLGGIGVLSIGATPKVQRIYTYNYSINVNTFQDNDFTDSRYRDDTTKANIDLGVALRPIPTVTLGLAARNLISHDITTVVTSGQSFVHTIEPEITLGAAWSIAGLTLAADVDVIDVDRFKNIVDESQFIRAGFEYSVFGWAQLRGGVQHDFEGTVDNVFTGGIGISPFNTVHVDIALSWDGDKAFGGMAQFWFTF